MNIKQLCTECNIEYNSRNPKRSLKLIKEKYIITELSHNDYTIERKLTDEEYILLSKKNKAEELLYNIILTQLSQSNTNTVRANTKELLEKFYLVNNKYKLFSYEDITEEKLKVLSTTDLSESILENFYSDTYPILSRMLKKVLHRLEDEALIKIVEIPMYAVKKRLGDTGKTYIDTHEVTTDQMEEVLRITREEMLNLPEDRRADKWSDLQYYDKGKIKKEVCRQLHWAYTYNDYNIILNRQGIIEETNNLLVNLATCKKLSTSRQGELKNYDKELMDKCINFLIKTT